MSVASSIAENRMIKRRIQQNSRLILFLSRKKTSGIIPIKRFYPIKSAFFDVFKRKKAAERGAPQPSAFRLSAIDLHKETQNVEEKGHERREQRYRAKDIVVVLRIKQHVRRVVEDVPAREEYQRDREPRPKFKSKEHRQNDQNDRGEAGEN